MKYLDPKNDVVFKKIFGEHPHLLMSFLNELLPLEDNQKIIEIEYLVPEMVPEIPVLKNSIVDVRCVDQNGRIFIVEIQMLWTNAFMLRVLFNASKAYVRQLNKREKYDLLKPVYGLSIVNDIFDKDSDEFYHHYKIVNIENTSKILKGLQFVFIELPKFTPDKLMHKKLAVLWLRFMKEVDEDNETVSNDFSEHELIREALQISQESAFSKVELETYDMYWDYVRTEKTIRDGSYDEGMQQGIQKGIELVAINLLNIHKPYEEVALLTGLSIESVRNLKKNVKSKE